MKKYLIPAIIVGMLLPLVALSAPTSTIVNDLIITRQGGSGVKCLHVNNLGYVSTSTADCGTGGTTTTITGDGTATGPAFTFSTSTDTNMGVRVSGSGSTINFLPVWIGTLADGRISSAATWNAKEPGITAGTSAQYWRGDKTFQTLDTSVVPENGNQYFTNARARGAVSAGNGLSYNSGTGVFVNAGVTSWNGATGTIVFDPYAAGFQTSTSTTFLWRSNNLSDLTNTATARTNLGLSATAPITLSAGGAYGCATCVTNVTGSGNIASSGGTTPNITFTGTLPIANGGTATTTFIRGLVVASGTTPLWTLAPGADGTAVFSKNAGTDGFEVRSIAQSDVTGLKVTDSPTHASTTLSNFTLGSVPFIGVGGAMKQNNPKLFWDNTNFRLGIGTSTPASSLTIGDAASLTGYTGRQFTIFDGSSGAPVTTAGPSLEVFRYENIASSTCAGNVTNYNCSAGISANSIGDPASTMQVNAIQGFAQGSMTTAGTDIFGMIGRGTVTGSGVGIGAGGYFEGKRNTDTGKANAAELSAWNNTSSPCAYSTTGFSDCIGLWLAARGSSTASYDSAAIQVDDVTTQWYNGIGFNPGSVIANTIYDNSNSSTSIAIDGTHTNAFTSTFAAGNIGFGTTTPATFFSVATSSQPIFNILSGGNIGIGTSTPATALHLYKPSGSNALEIDSGTFGGTIGSSGNANYNFFLLPRNSGDIRFYNSTGTIANVTVQNEGNVGIGTTTPIAPLTVLTTKSTTGIFTQRDYDGLYDIANRNFNNSTSSGARVLLQTNGAAYTTEALDTNYVGTGMRQSAAGVVQSNGLGGLSIAANNASAALRFYTGGNAAANERMRVTSGGLVGINTTNPSAFFEIGTSTTSNASFRLRQSPAPTSPNDGDHWYDNVQKTLIGWLNGIKVAYSGTLFTASASKTVANTVSDTSAIPTGVGTITLPANFCVVGKTVRIHGEGIYALPLGGGTATVKVKHAATTIASVNTSGLLSSVSGKQFILNANVTYRSCGASGSVIVGGQVSYANASNLLVTDALDNAGAATTVDTTAASALDVTLAWDTAVSTKVATTTIATYEVLN